MKWRMRFDQELTPARTSAKMEAPSTQHAEMNLEHQASDSTKCRPNVVHSQRPKAPMSYIYPKVRLYSLKIYSESTDV
jgi:hypothetical protein